PLLAALARAQHRALVSCVLLIAKCACSSLPTTPWRGRTASASTRSRACRGWRAPCSRPAGGRRRDGGSTSSPPTPTTRGTARARRAPPRARRGQPGPRLACRGLVVGAPPPLPAPVAAGGGGPLPAPPPRGRGGRPPGGPRPPPSFFFRG